MHIDRIVEVVEAIGIAVAVVDGVLVRRRHLQVLAEAATAAISGRESYTIDGVNLPRPEDVRWKSNKRNLIDAEGIPLDPPADVVQLGAVVVIVEKKPRVFIGTGVGCLDGCAATEYGKSVIRAYRQRLVDEPGHST